MSEAYLVKPDEKFVREIIGLGGEKLKQCFQCATCSVTCALSPDRNPFPRKEMIWAQWGLKDKLLSDPDVWLCHRCTDCTVHCPRGAAPGDVLAAVRDYSIRHYSTPGFMGKALGRPGLLPLLLAVPALLMLLFLGALGHLHIPEGRVEYAEFFPHLPLQIFFGFFSLLMIISVVSGVKRFWSGMSSNIPANPGGDGIGASIMGAIKDILTHVKFKDCTQNKNRYFSHLLTLYGFVGLLITTVGAVVSEYVFHYFPLPLFHPLKIFGNLSALAILAGVSWIMYERAVKQKDTEISTGYDWTFIGILFTVVITGITVEILRFADARLAAYPVYFVHLVFVFALLIYLPYSRFAHLVYRTAALVFARHTGREKSGDSK